MGETTSDHDLVAAVRAGDDHAFERLYGRYHRRIAAYVYGMVHDYAKAEDVTQDVFMSALRRMRETDRPIAFKPWIYEIAKNACIDQFRRSRRAEEISYDAEDGLGASDYRRLANTAPTPDVAVDTKLTLDNLRGAFGGLSETHHEILVMRELEGLSYREIGERLGMSRPSVESTLFRARRRLSEEYEELVTGERCRRIQGIIASAEGAQGATLGARDQRRMARHISYCQPCRRQARMAGVAAGVLARRPVREKIAALLPLPAFLRRRLAGGGSPGAQHDVAATATTGAHASGFAQWGSSLASYVDPSWVKAAATAATVAVAGVGAGVATTHGSGTGVPGLRVSHLGSGSGGGNVAGPPAAVRSGGGGSAAAPGSASGGGAAVGSGGEQHAGASGSASGETQALTQDLGSVSVAAAPGVGQAPTDVAGPVPATPKVGGKHGTSLKDLVGGIGSGANAGTSGGGRGLQGGGDAGGSPGLGIPTTGPGVSGTGEAVGGAVQGAGQAVGGTLQSAGTTVGGAVQGAGQATGDAVQGVADAVSGTTESAGDALNGIGGALPAGG